MGLDHESKMEKTTITTTKTNKFTPVVSGILVSRWSIDFLMCENNFRKKIHTHNSNILFLVLFPSFEITT